MYLQLWFDVSFLIYCYETIFNIISSWFIYLTSLCWRFFIFYYSVWIQNSFEIHLLWHTFVCLWLHQQTLSFISFHFISVLFSFPLRDFHSCLFVFFLFHSFIIDFVMWPYKTKAGQKVGLNNKWIFLAGVFVVSFSFTCCC